MNNLISNSDKFYWHQYIPFYEKFFENRNFANIAELGILEGESIKWLMQRFPDSNIYAADILDQQSTWPIDQRVKYYQLDQASRSALVNFFNQAAYDLVIEDGSHKPQHQVNCLVEAMPRLNTNGIYILEDIQTSMNQSQGNALTVLLAIDHFHGIDQAITEEIAEYIAVSSLLTAEEVYNLSKLVKKTSFYRRTRLPYKCYNCGSQVYNFSNLRCVCGVEIFSPMDSMTCVIEKQ